MPSARNAPAVTLALEWVHLLKNAHATPLVALTAALPPRLDMASPAVRIARGRLKSAGATLWSNQITHRLAYPELIHRGMTIADLPADAPARTDYERLWSAILQVEQLMKAPLRATAIAADLAEETEARAQICYRLSRERRDMLHRLALDRRTNLQGLLDEAVGNLLAKLQADS